jgi:hypothetical protein
MSIARPAHAGCLPGGPRAGSRSRGLRRLRRREARVAVLVALLAAVGATPGVARADDADVLLGEGRKLLKAGKVAEACSRLAESHRLSAKGRTLLELAACHEKQGKLATAWSEYIDVGAAARKEGNKRLEGEAKARGSRLELRLPRLTLSVRSGAEVDGFELKLDGATIDSSGWGQPRPLDPGEHEVSASAPGRQSWEFKVALGPGDKKSVAVPVLASDGSAAAPEPAVAAPEQAASGASPSAAGPGPGKGPESPASGGGAATEVKAETSSPPEVAAAGQGAEARRSSRWVADVGVAGGLLVGLIDTGNLGNLSSYAYTYNIPDGGTLNVLCSEDVCHTGFDPAAGAFMGGQAFFGYGMSERLQLGARLLGGYRFGGGYLIVGGPSGSMRFGSLWVGLSALVGGVSQVAKVTGIKGEIPSGYEDINYGQTEVDVAEPGDGLPETASVETLAFGGSVELSYVLAELRSSRWTSGAIVVSAWPTFMKGLEGVVIAAPVSLGYRFY